MTEERSLRVTVVQEASSLDPAVNRDRVRAAVPDGPDGPDGSDGSDGSGRADLVVFPEAFARDFGEPGSDLSAYAEPQGGRFDQAVGAAAAASPGTTVVAGMFETSSDPARPFNTLLVRGATTAAYRKIHLYDSFGYRESDAVHPGPVEPTVVQVAGFAVGLMTCYDLRFPELARLLVDAGAEVLVVPAAWVAGPRKVEHWRTLVRARAIENTVFVVAAGQPGPRYAGHSLVVDPWGEVLAQADEHPARLHASLSRESLDQARRTNPSLGNRRVPIPRPASQ